jgi:UDP-N-acetylmuramate dehydrogenase
MNLEEHVNIKNHTTFKVGGQFRYFSEAKTIDDVREIIQKAHYLNKPLFVIGGGSNLVFSDSVLDVVALKMNIKGFDVIKETNDYTDIKVGGGENWDSFVARTVDMNLSGIEALSSIPGTCGATPVQNVGAYGTEVKDTIVSVEVYDLNDNEVKNLTNEDCKFAYRDSIFKNEGKGRYIILSVTFRLLKSKATVPNYPGVKKYFEEKGITDPTLHDIREAIASIRSVKLPNPQEIPNVGSFFKNPIIEKEIAEKLVLHYPTLTTFPIDDSRTKVPAGWLIENTGLKGKNFGPISVYPHNALVLVNNGEATFKDVENVRDSIIEEVRNKFNITLETEPEFV